MLFIYNVNNNNLKFIKLKVIFKFLLKIKNIKIKNNFFHKKNYFKNHNVFFLFFNKNNVQINHNNTYQNIVKTFKITKLLKNLKLKKIKKKQQQYYKLLSMYLRCYLIINNITNLNFLLKTYINFFNFFFKNLNYSLNFNFKNFNDFSVFFNKKPSKFLIKSKILNNHFKNKNVNLISNVIQLNNKYVLYNYFFFINSISYKITYKFNNKKKKKFPSIKRRKLKTFVKNLKNLYYFYFILCSYLLVKFIINV